MQLEAQNTAVFEVGSGVPLLMGLMISMTVSIGLWMAAWWIGSLIAFERESAAVKTTGRTSVRTVRERAWHEAVRTALRPLLQGLLERGFRYEDLARMVAEILVRAEIERGVGGDARIAERTGVPRKLVGKVRKELGVGTDLPLPYATATRLIGRWVRDPAFSRGGKGRASPLRGERSFATLCEMAGVAPEVALPALKRAGLVKVVSGRVSPEADAYVPAGEIEKVDILGRDGAEFLRTMIYNTGVPPTRAMLQRKASYDNIGSAALKRLRDILRVEAGRALRAANDTLAACDRDRNPAAPGGRRTRVSFGVYLAEEAVDARGGPIASRPRRRRRS